jgi:hypothetical protein
MDSPIAETAVFALRLVKEAAPWLISCLASRSVDRVRFGGGISRPTKGTAPHREPEFLAEKFWSRRSG